MIGRLRKVLSVSCHHFAALLCVFTGWTCGTALAQVNQFEGKPVVAVAYSAPSALDPADLARLQPIKPGDPLRSEQVAQAIDGLFSSGLFFDVAVEAEASGNGVALRFVTQPEWFVGGIGVDGKIGGPPNRGELHSNTHFSLGTQFHDEDVANAVDSLTRLLKSNGFYEGQVTPTIERASNEQQVFVTFNIKEGKRAKYEQPEIEGNLLLPAATILRATGWRVPIIHLWLKVSDVRTRNGVAGVQNKYQQKDRLTAKVELRDLEYDSAKRRVRPHLSVNAGPKVKVTAIETKVSRRVLKRYVPVFDERTVDTDLLVEGKRNLEDYFQSQGYHDVDIDFRVRPPENDLETIEYVISRGERHKVAVLFVTGNRYFDTPTIRERMFIAPAALNLRHGRYSEAFRRKDEANIAELYQANGFRDIKVAITLTNNYKGKEGDVAVTVTITEGPQWLVDKVTITGLEKLKRSNIESGLASAAGQPFSDVNLATDRN
ncbi:MAG TPA: POTRA domain-containing protein, partial [Chthoniobacterales bacterium]